MTVPIVLASGSEIRAQLLRNAGVPFSVQVARVDEDTAKRALLAEGAPPRDIADALAELKARKISDKTPGAMVLGCDQVLDFDGRLLSKPETPEEALAGVTRHAARALGLTDCGMIAPGLRADLVIWDAEQPAELAYRIGVNPLHARMFGGAFD